MPRHPRIDLPDIAQHIIQRGNDRQACFFEDIDRVRYLHDLRDIARREHCRLHAYVLMTNHVHLLATPAAPGQVGRMMQALGRRYVRYINARYQRTGTLWEGRYKACPVMDERYLLRCQRYIELNPVRAGITVDPAGHPWSSPPGNILSPTDPLLTPHPAWLALGGDLPACRKAWRDWVMEDIDPHEIDAIRQHLRQQRVYAPERLRQAVEARIGRVIAPRKIGRPRRTEQ